MRFLDRDPQGNVHFTFETKKTFLVTHALLKDAWVMDLLGSLGFSCGDSRWNNPILWSHLESGRIVVAVFIPHACIYWHKDPVHSPAPNDKQAFVHEAEYEVRILHSDGVLPNDHTPTTVHTRRIPKTSSSSHWLTLPQEIRKAWYDSARPTNQ